MTSPLLPPLTVPQPTLLPQRQRSRMTIQQLMELMRRIEINQLAQQGLQGSEQAAIQRFPQPRATAQSTPSTFEAALQAGSKVSPTAMVSRTPRPEPGPSLPDRALGGLLSVLGTMDKARGSLAFPALGISALRPGEQGIERRFREAREQGQGVFSAITAASQGGPKTNFLGIPGTEKLDSIIEDIALFGTIPAFGQLGPLLRGAGAGMAATGAARSGATGLLQTAGGRGLQASGAALSPLAAVEALPGQLIKAPFRGIDIAAKTARRTLRPRTPSVVGMPQVYGEVPGMTPIAEMVRQVQSPNLMQQTMDALKISPHWQKRIMFFNQNAVADFTQPEEQIRLLIARGSHEADSFVDQMGQLLRAKGDLKGLLKIDAQGISHAAWLRTPTSYNLMFQFPKRYPLPDEVRNVLNRWKKLSTDVRTMARAEGVELPAEMTTGEYFPNFWRSLDGMDLGLSAGLRSTRPFAGKAPQESARWHLNTRSALEEGWRSGGDPLEDMLLYFRTSYRMVQEARIKRIFNTYSKTIANRYLGRDAIDETLRKAVSREKGIKLVSQTLRARLATPAAMPLRGSPWAGKQALLREAPDLVRRMEEGVPYEVIADTRVRKKWMGNILKQVRKLEQDAVAARKLAKEAQQVMRRKARQRGGEMQMKPLRLKGRIYTPEELAERLAPEVDLSDIKLLPREQLQRIGKELEPLSTNWMTSMRSVNAAIRTGVAGFDFGVGQIHGAVLFATNPIGWAKATGISLAGMLNAQVLAQHLSRHNATVQKLSARNVMGSRSEFIEAAAPGGILHRAASGFERAVPIPVVGKAPRVILEAFERQFSGFIKLGKVYTWEALENQAIRQGGPKALDDLANHVGKMFGTLSFDNLGMMPMFQQFLAAIPLFAPQYRMATWGLMIDVARGGLRGELARDSLAKLAAAGLIVHYAVAKGLGQEPKLDPTKGDFLTWEIGGNRVGIGTAYRSTVRMIMGTVAQIAEDGPDAALRIDKQDSVLGRSIRYAVSPLAALAWDISTRRSAMGEERENLMDFIKNSPDYVLPFAISGMMDNPRPGWTALPFLMAGTNAYAMSEWDRYKQQVELLAEKEWDDISSVEESELLETYPELQAQKDKSNLFWAERGMDTDLRNYREAKDRALGVYEVMVDEAIANFMVHGLGQEFIEDLEKAGGYLHGERIGREQDFADLLAEFGRVASDPEADLLDIAKEHYLREVVGGVFEVVSDGGGTGEYNYGARRHAEEQFIAIWGPEIAQRVIESTQRSRYMPPVLVELDQARQELRRYWELGEHILRKIGREDLLETTPDTPSKWSQYLRDRAYPDKREESEALYPTLAKVYKAQRRARELLRMQDAQLERTLLRWGYVRSPQNPENMNIPLDPIRRTPQY